MRLLESGAVLTGKLEQMEGTLLDWVLEDPAGQGIESVRPIRDEIRGRILTLLDELGVSPVHV